jgi:hypothetical protein
MDAMSRLDELRNFRQLGVDFKNSLNGSWASRTCSVCLFYSAHDLFSRSHAIYDAILPAGGGVRAVVQKARVGIPTERWFARKVPGGETVVLVLWPQGVKILE